MAEEVKVESDNVVVFAGKTADLRIVQSEIVFANEDARNADDPEAYFELVKTRLFEQMWPTLAEQFLRDGGSYVVHMSALHMSMNEQEGTTECEVSAFVLKVEQVPEPGLLTMKVADEQDEEVTTTGPHDYSMWVPPKRGGLPN